MKGAAKLLRFPLGGLAKDGSYRDTTYPTEESVYSTPMAKNVIGECAFSSRLRGGSRPGLKLFDEDGKRIETAGTARWLWPNGERILWPDGNRIVFGVPETATTPDGSTVVLSHPPTCIYRDRVFKADGSVWMASRTGDHGNFDFGGEADEPTRACAGNLAYAGRKGDDITTFAPFGDSRIFIATRRSLAVIGGEPTSAMAMVSENVGIVSADAWCNADGAFYFMGPNGLYVAAESSAILVSQKIPEDLKGLEYALLVYDPHYRGIHVFTERGDWFFDIAQKAFWPVEYPPQMMPDAGGVAVINNVNRVIFHCVDGEWRYWDDLQTTDDGEDIASVVAIGPFKCGVNDDVDGMLDALTATMAKGSSVVDIDIYTANDAETAVANATSDVSRLASFTVIPGWNPVVRPRVRGAWCVLVLRATGRWAYESIQANIKVLGRLRP